MNLSALDVGKVFHFVDPNLGTANYLKTAYNGTDVTYVVVYNLKTCGFEQLLGTTQVALGTLTVGATPTFVVG